MTYRLRTNGTLSSERQLRELFPNLSLPTNLTDAVLNSIGFDAVLPSDKPTLSDGQVASITGASIKGDGKYHEDWSITNLPPDQAAAALAASRSMQRVTMRQARLALLAFGKLAQVNAAVAAMTGPTGDAVRIEWEFSSEVLRNRPLVTNLAASLGWSDTDLDQLFAYAGNLT